jgi:hypothetical protein
MAGHRERSSEGEDDEKEFQFGSDKLLGQEEVPVERIVAQAADIRSFGFPTCLLRDVPLSKLSTQGTAILVSTTRAEHIPTG